MTIKLNWWLWVGLFTLLFSVFALLGWIARAQSYEPVIVTEIVASPPEIRTQIVTQNVTEYVERVVIKEMPYLIVFPVETTFVPYLTSQPSLNEVVSILEEAKRNHQYYIDHPEKQSEVTGNTTFNELWVNNYMAIIGYIREVNKQD